MSDAVGRIRNLGWQWQVVIVWAVTRLLDYAFFVAASLIQGRSYWNGPQPAYFDFLNIWDAEWYHRIFDHGFGEVPGYPFILPLSDSGLVQQNSWAFLPAYPLGLKALNLATGIEFKYLAPTISLILSFLFAIVLYRLFRLFANHETVLWSIFLFGISTAAAVLQTGYAESMALLLLAGSLYLVLQRRYLLAVPVVALLSLTRPGALALALALGLIWIYRWWQFKKVGASFDISERLRLAVLTVATAGFGFVWNLIAWVCTGRSDAYLATELAWSFGYTGQSELRPFSGWPIAAKFYLGDFGVPVLLVLVGLTTWMLFSHWLKPIGVELRIWLASYFTYLLAVFFPQSSTFRLLLPAFAVFLAVGIATVNSKPWVKAILVSGLVLSQVIWILTCWVYVSPDFTPP
jgi:hypothetical protein